MHKVKNDSSYVKLKEMLINEIKNDVDFCKKSFNAKGSATLGFGGERAPYSMSVQIDDPFNSKYQDTWHVAARELTWLLRHSTVRFHAEITQFGQMQIHYTLYDLLDLTPSKNRSGMYNKISNLLGKMYHDKLKGAKLEILAHWIETIDDKCSVK